ncbi:unnamed protein product [Dibothriocephalus latus]|uniref:Uncharacterized protein n=1 Tax=Dibothriocephalus latus TaxID=60516 RepID=A0A3P7P0B0_DIBLA|nr:unnamed protein product [Dibothriocephalus latus]
MEVLVNEQVVDILPHVPRKELTLRRVLEYFSGCSLQEYDHDALCTLNESSSRPPALKRTEL